ncbi:hypothetical protein EVAR_49775_1 [Eumeta japonica]|uniref:Uncharacterized protein n=1 Tax=Eumeta variegata TaxID=151549 RepID=A0A4C1Y1E5_EUMVA|nr:hypothetical protein EVAR_49775_1 [Eumeta japonica]
MGKRSTGSATRCRSSGALLRNVNDERHHCSNMLRELFRLSELSVCTHGDKADSNIAVVEHCWSAAAAVILIEGFACAHGRRAGCTQNDCTDNEVVTKKERNKSRQKRSLLPVADENRARSKEKATGIGQQNFHLVQITQHHLSPVPTILEEKVDAAHSVATYACWRCRLVSGGGARTSRAPSSAVLGSRRSSMARSNFTSTLRLTGSIHTVPFKVGPDVTMGQYLRLSSTFDRGAPTACVAGRPRRRPPAVDEEAGAADGRESESNTCPTMWYKCRYPAAIPTREIRNSLRMRRVKRLCGKDNTKNQFVRCRVCDPRCDKGKPSTS